MKRKKFTKAAFVLSVCMLALWAVLGTGTTLAWFTDTTSADKNSFIIGNLELEVEYKNDVQPNYDTLTTGTSVFNNSALYEPGYTQVAYLKIRNAGDIPFDYKLSVDILSYVDSTSSLGTPLHLPDYLQFGVLFGADEAELDRELARFYAEHDLVDLHYNTYSQPDITVAPGDLRYVALVVYMPEDVDNAANFLRGEDQPQVNLGITLFAQQAGTPLP